MVNLCMSAFVVLDLVQYYAMRLARKNVSEMTFLCQVGCKTLVSQSFNSFLYVGLVLEG